MKGFTLVEVLVVTVVFALLVGILALTLLNNTDLQTQQSVSVEQGVESNEAFLSIRAYVKEALSVAIQYPQSGSAQYTSSAGELVLQLSSISAANDVIPSVYDYVVYHVEGDKLKLKISPDVQSSRALKDQILASNVSTVLFQYYDAGGMEVSPAAAVKIKITLNLEHQSGKDTYTKTSTTEVNLRND